jgi:hypothetical protein
MAAAASNNHDNHNNPANNQINTTFIPYFLSTVRDDTPTIVYISVGSAALTRNADGRVSEENYQQFPETIRKMFLSSEKCDIFIILIDQMLEENIYVVNDKLLHEQLGIKNFTLDQENGVFESKNEDRNVYVYPIRRSIYISKLEYYREDVYDITEGIRNLDEITKQENIFISLCYFSGTNIYDVAEEYIQRYGETNITFGFNRQDHGCYTDLTDTFNHYIFKLVDAEQRKKFVVFNIYELIDRKFDVNYAIEYFGIENIESIQHQVSKFIAEMWSKFIDHELWFLRVIYRLKYQFNADAKNLINGFDATQTYNMKLINIRDKIQINRLILEQKYDELFWFVINKYADHFDNMQCITQIINIRDGRRTLMSGLQIMKFIMKDHTKEWDEKMDDFDPSVNCYNFGTNINKLRLS